MMVDNATRKATLQQYVERFNAADAQGVAALYADDATVEDPVGGEVIAGRDAIRAFYRHTTSLGARLEVMAPPRGSHGDAAALTFSVHVRMEGRPARIDVTDVMTFGADGRIRSMRAYWGPDDLHFV
uniref:Nuclear transport factor 2 n=2 Tax=Cupriavidus TaxID=106589 RepID=Q471Q2_CUPPJ|nr:nuclear transport factor 2 family protein [Cupriavidus necator]